MIPVSKEERTTIRAKKYKENDTNDHSSTAFSRRKGEKVQQY
jgi:hypothetical protein